MSTMRKKKYGDWSCSTRAETDKRFNNEHASTLASSPLSSNNAPLRQYLSGTAEYMRPKKTRPW